MKYIFIENLDFKFPITQDIAAIPIPRRAWCSLSQSLPRGNSQFIIEVIGTPRGVIETRITDRTGIGYWNDSALSESLHLDNKIDIIIISFNQALYK